uniref:Uncharacterized protein n=1 Tax=Rhabditophanes sp. KR3021 TaxID=114890 RepID=A0AC35UHA8_9BILA
MFIKNELSELRIVKLVMKAIKKLFERKVIFDEIDDSEDEEINNERMNNIFGQKKSSSQNRDNQIFPVDYSFSSIVERTATSINDREKYLNSILSKTPNNLESVRLDYSDGTFYSLSNTSLENLVSSENTCTFSKDDMLCHSTHIDPANTSRNKALPFTYSNYSKKLI